MKTIDNTQSYQILSAVKGVISRVNNNTTPNEAFIDIVKQGSFSPEIVNRMIEAFNQSRAVKQLGAEGAEKAANFDIADPATIFSSVYNSEEAPAKNQEVHYDDVDKHDFMPKKATVQHRYESNPVEPYAEDINIATRTVFNKLAAVKQLVKEAEIQEVHYKYKITDLIKEAAQSLSRVDHEPYDDFERRIQRAYGESGGRLINAVYKFANIRKVVTHYEKQATFIMPQRSPYVEVAKAQAAAESLVECREKSASIKAKYETAASLTEKAASVPGTLLMGSYLRQRDAENEPSSYIQDEDYQSELKAVRLKSLLSDLVSSDSVIGSYEPSEIISAANSAVSLAPQAMDNRTALQSALRRTLVDHELSTDEALGLAESEAKIQKAKIDTDKSVTGAK